jgi:UDP-N-acetylmuramoylalanine--D-glutamate ligase
MSISPQIGAVLNITPNHLDRHGTLEAYTSAKARILAFQTAGDTAILNREDPGAWGLKEMARGKLVTFGFAHPGAGMAGTYLRGGRIWYTDGQDDTLLMEQGVVLLRGEHMLLNVLAACAVAAAAGWPASAMRAGVEGFHGVAHRLEFVGSPKGAAWYNDSIATAPERTIAAIQAFDEPLVLLLGGRDKKLPWEKLAALVHQRVEHVVVFGEASELILQAIGPLQPGSRLQSIHHAPGMHAAIQTAAGVVRPGSVVLLSPGGTSFDEFKDFEERGERFREWVKDLS